jgi:hypothetical protein
MVPKEVPAHQHARGAHAHGHARARMKSVSLFIIGLAIEDHKRAGGNPIDHSRNTHERGHRGDQIGDCSRHAGQEGSTQEPDATEERYPGSSVPSSYPVSG